MKLHRFLGSVAGLLALSLTAGAQTTSNTTTSNTTTSNTTTSTVPTNFGNMILTTTPSNATGNSGVSSIFTSSGNEFTFGTGGLLVNPAQFNYTITGPNTATVVTPASGTTPAATTTLTFNGTNTGSYSTASGNNTTTGNFHLTAIPTSAPIENVSVRSTVQPGGQTVVGFVVGGTMPQKVLIRAVGPGLTTFGVANALQRPQFTLYRGAQAILTQSAWGAQATVNPGTDTGGSNIVIGSGTSITPTAASADVFRSVGAFPLTTGSADAATVVTLMPGAYTIMVNSAASILGTATTGNTTSTGNTTTGNSTTGNTTVGNTTAGNSTTGNTTTGNTTTGNTTTGNTTTGNTTTGNTTTGNSTTGNTTTTGTTTTSTGGDVLVEVYFVGSP